MSRCATGAAISRSEGTPNSLGRRDLLDQNDETLETGVRAFAERGSRGRSLLAIFAVQGSTVGVGAGGDMSCTVRCCAAVFFKLTGSGSREREAARAASDGWKYADCRWRVRSSARSAD